MSLGTLAPRRGKKKPSAGAGVQGAAPPGFHPLVAQYTGYRLRNAQFSLRPDAVQGVASIHTPLHAPLPVRHSPVRSAPPSGVHRTTAGTRLCGVGTVPGRRVFRAARASASLAKSATVSRDASCSMRTSCESSEPLTRRRACWRLQSWLGLVLTDADRQTYPYLVEPVRVVRLSRCLRVGFSRFTRRTIVCLSERKHSWNDPGGCIDSITRYGRGPHTDNFVGALTTHTTSYVLPRHSQFG